MAKEIKTQVKLQIQAGRANPAPPVGPALGQAGVNIQEFCLKFNEATKDKMGSIIPVVITVFDDRSFTFITKTPPKTLNEFVPPSSDRGGGSGGDDRSRRIRKLLEIAIQVAKEKNVDELGMIHAMNMIAGDDFFSVAVEGILPDITDKEYMFVLQSAYKTIKQGLAEAEKTAKVFHPQFVDVYYLDGPRRTPLLVNRKVPYKLIDRYLEVVIKKYNLQQGRFEFRNAEEDPIKVTESVDYLEEK